MAFVVWQLFLFVSLSSSHCFYFFIVLFLFGSMRQIKLAARQLLGAR